MTFEVGDILYYRHYIWTVSAVETSRECLEPNQESYKVYHFKDRYSAIDEGSVTYNDIMDNYVKYKRC